MNKFEERIISDILKLLSIKSFTDDREGIIDCQTAVCEMATDLGFLCSHHGGVIVIEPRDKMAKQPELGIVVHLDTVPYDEKEWTANPLGEIKEGRIFGRGVIDDKAAIVLAMYAMLEKAKEIEPSWQIIVGSSEEGKWTDMKEYLEEGRILPKFLITVDGDGVQNGCRGYMDLMLTFERGSTNKSITDLQVVGGANNAVPGKAVAVIDDVIVEVVGKSAHSSIPHLGQNALVNLLYALFYVDSEFPGLFKLAEKLKDNYHGRCVGFKEHPEMIDGQNIGYTSVCLTNCQYMEDKIVANLNVRFSPYVTEGEITDAINNICLEYFCTAEVIDMKMPAYISPKAKEIQMMLDAYEEVLGKKTEATFAMGCGYNAALPNCAIFGPRFAVCHDEEDTCHSADENRSIEDTLTFYKMLCAFVEKFYS